MPLAYGDGMLERIAAVAPEIDAVFDLVGGESLRTVATLVDPGRLRAVESGHARGKVVLAVDHVTP